MQMQNSTMMHGAIRYDSRMEVICIFTPTYNRAYTLSRLFESLKAQTDSRFYWLIVDDGSTDGTEQLVDSFLDSSPFRIEYIKQPNAGKQIAHNTGVDNCKSELFFCVDSDDTIPPDCVESILTRWETCRNNSRLAGIIGLCGKDATTPLANEMPAGCASTTMWDLYYKQHHRGDTALIHRTDVLKQFPFWVAPGEKFIAETYVYHQIDQEYELAVLNKVLIIREYLEDGYTSNVRKITRDNPIGYMTLKRMYIGYSDTLYLKYCNSVLYLVGCILSNTKHGIRYAPNPAIAALAYIPAKILCLTEYRKR